MKNPETTKRLLQLATDLHNLNNKLYQLKITSEVFVVEEDKYSVESSLIDIEIENIIKEIKNVIGELNV